MTSTKYRNRESSFELLRLILMIMIVIHHCIVHGLGLSGLSESFNRNIVLTENQVWIAFGINAFCICAVNCFILISGYFKINVSAKRFLNLILSLIFYTGCFAIIPNIIEGNWRDIIRNCLFLSHSPYWFVIDYLFLMVFAPMLNLVYERFSKTKRRLILIGLIIISCYFGFLWGHPANKNGYTILQFLTIYSLGREIALSNLTINKTISVIVYIIGSLLLAFAGWFCWKIGFNELAWKTTFYNNPILVVSSLGLFMMFKNIKFYSPFVNILAKSAFGIYLFQSSQIVGTKMYNWLQTYDMGFRNWIFLIIIIISIAVSIIAITFDQIRIRFIEKILPYCVNLYKNTGGGVKYGNIAPYKIGYKVFQYFGSVRFTI